MSESDRPPSLDPARLADQAGWVRDLARRLVRDATDAEDLAQDVLLAGLEHPPHALDDRHLRGWLAGVARNLTLFRARGRGRRADRERTAARSAIAPGTDEVVARAQEVRRLVDAVLALEEPNKSAVLLAHLEGLSSRAIAKRLGTTPQNARKRVSRGLGQVRARLAREDRAGSADWLSGLYLVAHLPTPLLTTAASPAAVLMSSKLLTASLVGALALFGLMAYLGSGSPAESPGLLPGASATTDVDEELLEVGSADGGEAGRRATPALSAVPASEEAVPTVITRRGSVRDAHDDRPIVGAELREASADASYSDRVLAVTNSAGEFSIDDDGSWPEGFCVVHPGTFELHVERARIDSGAPLDLVVVELGGVTVRASKEGGGPAAGERISYSIDPIHGSDAQMWRWRRMVPAGATDADGVLEVDGLPVGTPLRFRFQNDWVASLQTVIDPTLRRAEVELVRPAWSAVRMRLVDAAGAPVVGALVNWYGTLHRSGDGRSFRAGQDGVVTITDIRAGYGALVFPRLVHAPIELTVAPGETRDLGNIVLAPPLEVSGTLRSVTGADLSALRVTVFQARIAGGSVPVAADGAFRASAIDAPLTLVVTGRTLGWGPEYAFDAVALARVDLVGPTTGVLIELQAGAGVLAARLPEDAGPAAVAYEVLALDCEVDWNPPSPLLSAADVAPRERGLIATGPIEPGTYDLVVEHPVLGTGMAAGLTPSSDLDADLPEVVFGDGKLVVELEDVDGATTSGVVYLRHHTEEQSTSRKGRRLDVAGRAVELLAPGGYSVRAEVGGLTSQRWQHVRILPGESTRVVLRAAARAVLSGRVTRGGAPLARLALATQRHDPPTNLSWSATTDADGRFKFEPLLPGAYSVWAVGEFSTFVTLAAGDGGEFEWELGDALARVEIRANGRLATEVETLRVCALEAETELYAYLARVEPGIFEGALPDGSLFFDLVTTGMGVGKSFIAVGPPHAGGSSYELDLARNGVELVPSGTSLEVQPPVARLIEVAGRRPLSMWGQPVILAHRMLDGRVVWPYLPAGAVIELEGLAPGAGRKQETVRVGASGLTRVTW